ncbi:dynamin family protein [Anaerobacillus sp. CMMVII]|uniref:dynamin family protein n=1 Tax=Anaerobacillus sp. CMMVII TaxID=2755588 RepID=UPI0021B70EB6|nr:dynamin family protein [Anaerobacillus sp. CMMVII]MCT8137673.1 dynamin family protein [Anaerobacillus sp. CMMVII]
MVDLKTYVLEAKNTLHTSPIRKLKQSGKALPELQANGKHLEKAEEHIEMLLEKVNSPLKVVIMGEVKAGKSTLLNALSGGQVSPVNVAEATATIIEISHHSEPKGTIVREAEEISGSAEEIFTILENKRGDKDYFEKTKYVKLGFPLANLQKLKLVDTPGLATVREENAARTEAYIQESDVVLWVFNGNHLGQADIEEKLEEVAMLGKPIVALVNKIDEVTTDPMRLVDYLENRVDIFAEQVLPISAQLAYEGITENDEAKLERSHFPELLCYLEENIERDDTKVQAESIQRSTDALLYQDKIIHESYSKEIDFMLQQMKSRKEDLVYHNQGIKESLEISLKNWFYGEFLETERDVILTKVSNLGLLSKKADKEEIKQLIVNSLAPERVQAQLEQKYAQLNEEFQMKWQQVIRELNDKVILEANQFEKSHEQEFSYKLAKLDETLPTGEDFLKEGMGKGAAIGGAYGASAAAYVAWLGPYAASVSLGTALAAMLPPVLIIGAVTGAVAKIVTYKSTKQKYEAEVEGFIKDIKRQLSETFIPKMTEQLKLQSNHVADEIYHKLCNSLCQNWTEQSLAELQHGIQRYTIRLAPMPV